MPKKTPSKTSKPRKRTATHHACSKKRTLLKERIRLSEQRIDDLDEQVHQLEMVIRILNDEVRLLVRETGSNDPFGKALAVPPEEVSSLDTARRKGRHMSSPP